MDLGLRDHVYVVTAASGGLGAATARSLVAEGAEVVLVDGLATSNGLWPGLAVLTKQLADELGPHGARVVALMPGRIETERVQQLDGLAPDPAGARAAAEARIPLRRPRSCCRPRPPTSTGCVVPVEGGALRAL